MTYLALKIVVSIASIYLVVMYYLSFNSRVALVRELCARRSELDKANKRIHSLNMASDNSLNRIASLTTKVNTLYERIDRNRLSRNRERRVRKFNRPLKTRK
mgnify:CR=1 FL=1